jgi:hypothetical protein
LPRLLISFGQEANSDFIKCRHIGQREFGFSPYAPVFVWLLHNNCRSIDVLQATNGRLITSARRISGRGKRQESFVQACSAAAVKLAFVANCDYFFDVGSMIRLFLAGPRNVPFG